MNPKNWSSKKPFTSYFRVPPSWANQSEPFCRTGYSVSPLHIHPPTNRPKEGISLSFVLLSPQVFQWILALQSGTELSVQLYGKTFCNLAISLGPVPACPPKCVDRLNLSPHYNSQLHATHLSSVPWDTWANP